MIGCSFKVEGWIIEFKAILDEIISGFFPVHLKEQSDVKGGAFGFNDRDKRVQGWGEGIKCTIISCYRMVSYVHINVNINELWLKFINFNRYSSTNQGTFSAIVPVYRWVSFNLPFSPPQ